MQAIDALREIFTVALLPDRKLVSFEDQPLSAVPSGKEGLRCLLYYHFEDQLKKRCESMLQLTLPCLHGTASQCLSVSGLLWQMQRIYSHVLLHNVVNVCSTLQRCCYMVSTVPEVCWGKSRDITANKHIL